MHEDKAHIESEETEEISLDTVAGVLAFTEHVDEQYENFLLLAKEVEEVANAVEITADGKGKCKELMASIRTAFESLETGREVSSSEAASIQSYYDEFLTTFSTLESIYETSILVTSVAPLPTEEVSYRPSLDSMFPERELNERAILSKRVLQSPRYQQLIKQNFASPAALEATLWRLVRSIEEPSRLDKFLGVRHGSLFTEIFKGKTIAEVHFLNQQDGASIRNALLEMEGEDKHQYDYRTYVAWMDEFEYMRDLLTHDEETLFEDLLVMAQLELLDSK